MSDILKIAGVQFEPFAETTLSVSQACELIRVASSKGAKIISLSQLFANRWFPSTIDKDKFSLAEQEDGFIITTLRELALDEGITLIAPIFEKAQTENGDEYFNTAFVIGTKGEIIGKYRKLHIPQLPLWEEKSYFKKGDLGLPVFESNGVKFGVLLCWDVFYPDAFRTLSEKGAQIVFAPTASAYYHARHKWERAIQASSHVNGLFTFRVNRVGKEDKQAFYGRSFCVAPDGEFILKPSGPSEGIVLADIQLKDIDTVRREWAFAKERSKEDYTS